MIVAQGTVLRVNLHKNNRDPLCENSDPPRVKNDPRGSRHFKIRVITQNESHPDRGGFSFFASSIGREPT